jgi:(p)ppGpp synthase/HD superfamily hydrolase
MLTERFQDAFAYAARVHGNQRKKGTDVPYLAHLMDVAALVLMNDGHEVQAIAALLHDAAEDAGGRDRLADIRRRFGDAVAEIVEGCSDTFDDPKPPWLERKKAYIDHLPQASPATRLVSAADKLANVRVLIADVKAHGEGIWDRFNGKKEGTVWYYRAVANVFLSHGPHPLAERLDEEVRELEQLASGSARYASAARPG